MHMSLSKQIRHKILSCIDANILVGLVQAKFVVKISRKHLVCINPLIIDEQSLYVV